MYIIARDSYVDSQELLDYLSHNQTDRHHLRFVSLYSHWSSSYNTALSLVESFRVFDYFHARKGPIIGAL